MARESFADQSLADRLRLVDEIAPVTGLDEILGGTAAVLEQAKRLLPSDRDAITRDEASRILLAAIVGEQFKNLERLRVAKWIAECGPEADAGDRRRRACEFLGWRSHRAPSETRREMLYDFWLMTSPESPTADQIEFYRPGDTFLVLGTMQRASEPMDAVRGIRARYGSSSLDSTVAELEKGRREAKARMLGGAAVAEPVGDEDLARLKFPSRRQARKLDRCGRSRRA